MYMLAWPPRLRVRVDGEEIGAGRKHTADGDPEPRAIATFFRAGRKIFGNIVIGLAIPRRTRKHD